jgi:uncharacterized protein (UPF0276 family)
MHLSTLPPETGVSFKPEHFADILEDPRRVGFFEVHAENYMGAGGPPHAQLGKLREDYDISVHGVGLSIGSTQPLSLDHLRRLKTLCDRYQPESFSEHLAWSSHESEFLNDLLPLPYTPATLRSVIDHIDQVQNALGRQMLLEDPATYLVFEESTIDETDFLREIAARSGCGLLLDVNNVFVACSNQRLDPEAYIARFPLERVREIHLSGHAEAEDDQGATLLIDTHDTPVTRDVWELYREVLDRAGPVATLVEWDNSVPEWAVLRDEAEQAERLLRQARSGLGLEMLHAHRL